MQLALALYGNRGLHSQTLGPRQSVFVALCCCLFFIFLCFGATIFSVACYSVPCCPAD